MREELFGITDNLIPCMKHDMNKIFYKFLVKKKKNKHFENLTLRKYKAEQMEYDDIGEVELENDDWQQASLRYVSMIFFFFFFFLLF